MVVRRVLKRSVSIMYKIPWHECRGEECSILGDAMRVRKNSSFINLSDL